MILEPEGSVAARFAVGVGLALWLLQARSASSTREPASAIRLQHPRAAAGAIRLQHLRAQSLHISHPF